MYCFLLRNHMVCTTSNVEALMKTLSFSGDALSLELCKLQILETLCPRSIQLQYIPSGTDAKYDLEIVFPLVAGTRAVSESQIVSYT
jgi:hypothetical protein